MRVRTWEDDNDDIIELSEAVEAADLFSTELESDMATLKKKGQEAAAAPAAKKAGKAKEAAPEKAKGVFGPREVPEGFVGLNTLAVEAGISPAAARRKLRTMEGMTKPEGQHGWYWKDGSKDLGKVRAALKPAA